LLYSENNNFKKVVSEGVQTENNEVFIDRPGRNFQFILDYLRTGEIKTEVLTMDRKIEIIEECSLYGVININYILN